MNNQTLLDLDSMQDDTLDDIAEAPDYINPPAGDYRLLTVGGKINSFTNDDGVTSQNFTVTIAVQETLELVDDLEPPVPEGSLFTIRFYGTHEGLAKLKREVRKMANVESLTGTSLRNISELLESGLEFNGRVSYSKFKGKEFLKLTVK